MFIIIYSNEYGIFNRFAKQGKKCIGRSTLGQFNNSGVVRGSKAFLSSNSLVAKIVFLILVVNWLYLTYPLGFSNFNMVYGSFKRSPKLISGMKPAEVAKVVTQDPAIPGSIPVMRSTNQRDGLEFTYTCWLFINHLQKTGTRKHVFHKGSSSQKQAVMVLTSS